jgi:hypothetical protein
LPEKVDRRTSPMQRVRQRKECETPSKKLAKAAGKCQTAGGFWRGFDLEECAKLGQQGAHRTLPAAASARIQAPQAAAQALL